MMVTYDNAFRLPGCEATSRGTIVVLYSFPPGVQKATKSSLDYYTVMFGVCQIYH